MTSKQKRIIKLIIYRTGFVVLALLGISFFIAIKVLGGFVFDKTNNYLEPKIGNWAFWIALVAGFLTWAYSYGMVAFIVYKPLKKISAYWSRLKE